MNPWLIGDGAYIKIKFTKNLVGDVTGNQDHFIVTWEQYNFVPNGELIEQSYSPIGVYPAGSDDSIVLEMPTLHHFYNAVGQITVAYDGVGTLAGAGGAVEAFEVSFTPTDLIPKPNQNDQNHLEITATKTGVLTRVYYTYTKNDEHISIADASWTGVLTHIDDL